MSQGSREPSDPLRVPRHTPHPSCLWKQIVYSGTIPTFPLCLCRGVGTPRLSTAPGPGCGKAQPA